MELFGNRNFTLTTANGKRSRLRRLKNGVPQGSIMAPLLCNIYSIPLTCQLLFPVSIYAYAKDLAVTHADGD